MFAQRRPDERVYFGPTSVSNVGRSQQPKNYFGPTLPCYLGTFSLFYSEPKPQCKTTVESRVVNGAEYLEQHTFETEEVDRSKTLCFDHSQCTSASFRRLSSNIYVCLLHGGNVMLEWRTEAPGDQLITKTCSSGNSIS